jgi:PAS domain-containing protein
MQMPINFSTTLTDILSHIPGGVAVFSARRGHIHLEYTNPGFYVLHHGSREYWSHQSDDPVDWLTEEDRHLFNEELAAVQSGAQKEGSVTYRIVGEDGNLYWVNNQFCPAFEQDGVQYYYASFVDMDEQKLAGRLPGYGQESCHRRCGSRNLFL